MSRKANPFTAEAIEAICRHMNQDHQEDSLLICRTAGGLPEASRASVRSVDGDGVDFAAMVDGQERTVRVPWGGSITERSEVRMELTRLTLEARARSVEVDRDAAP